MSTTVTPKLHAVHVFENKDGHANVIGMVQWAVEFQQGDFVSRAGIETFLDVSDLSNFVPIEQVTREQVLAWAFAAQGGDSFIENIRPYHESDIEVQTRRSGMVVYTDIATDLWPAGDAKPTIPQQVL